jgi:hypothetical protein
MRRAITLAGATAALVVGGAATATAAPPEQEAIPLVCDDGNTYEVVVNGNGAFTPGRLVGSTGVLVPTAFGETTFRAELPDGEVIEETEPASAKGGGNVSAHNPRETVTCTFELTDTLEEEEDGLPAGTVVTISGEVTGFLTGRA